MRKFIHQCIRYFGGAALCVASFTTSAGIIINGTRVIYPSDAKEVTVKLNNTGAKPVLIQSWIDSGNTEAKPENISVPFILTPPINRVEASKGQTLRLSYTGAPLPTDKESVFWLNVLEIPAKSKAPEGGNVLQMAFRSRIKLFFRPASLTGNANDAAKSMTWSATSGGLMASNPTPYHVSLVTVTVNGKQVEGRMVSPGGNATFALPAARSGSKVELEFVNDYGAVNKTESSIR